MLDRNNQNQVSEEVIHSVEKMVNLEIADIDHLIELASQNKRKRIRYCSHKNPSEKVHEMFIVHPNGAYVRPHKHINKIESMLVLRGEVDYVVFNDDGSIFKVIPMGDLKSGKVFYNSLREQVFHTLLIRTEWLVFVEITKGPFSKKDTEFASWSPNENDFSGRKTFMERVSFDAGKFIND
jgi:cupin fold WbuC family metalloprotein